MLVSRDIGAETEEGVVCLVDTSYVLPVGGSPRYVCAVPWLPKPCHTRLKQLVFPQIAREIVDQGWRVPVGPAALWGQQCKCAWRASRAFVTPSRAVSLYHQST
jgi:hypothetical protein